MNGQEKEKVNELREYLKIAQDAVESATVVLMELEREFLPNHRAEGKVLKERIQLLQKRVQRLTI